jgi:hypothetical protein
MSLVPPFYFDQKKTVVIDIKPNLKLKQDIIVLTIINGDLNSSASQVVRRLPNVILGMSIKTAVLMDLFQLV